MHDDLLAPFITSPGTSGLFLDFDGTVSEIVSEPSAAQPVGGIVDALERLSRALGVVAVVSGRRAAELVERLGPNIEIWGVHGAERVRAGAVELAPSLAPLVPKLQDAADELKRSLAHPDFAGVMLEDKGIVLAVHYRNASRSDAEARVGRLTRDVGARYGFDVGRARVVYELRPPEAPTKKTVVLDRAREEGLSAAAFIGDDAVDIAAFDALDELDAEGVTTLRVAVDSAEAPRELIERAQLVLDGPPEVRIFLERFLSLIEARRG